MWVSVLLLPGLIKALRVLPRVGPSPKKYTRLVYIPEQEELDGLPKSLKKHIRAARDAPECPLTAKELHRIFAYYRGKGTLARSRTKQARTASFVFGDNNITFKLGPKRYDGGLLLAIQAQAEAWEAAGFKPTTDDEAQWTVEEYAYVATDKLLEFYDKTYLYLLDNKGIKLTMVHIQMYRKGYTGNAHFDTRMNPNEPGKTARLLVPAQGDEGRPIAFYVGNKGYRGFLDMRQARLLTLATGPIFMTDLGAGGSPILGAGQVELGHEGDDAHASEVFVAHAPYPKGMPTTKPAATVVFTGKPAN